MTHSFKSLALIGFFALFPLEVFASPSTQAADRCARLDRMLEEAHLSQPDLDPVDFEYLDKSLKREFTRLCGEGAGLSTPMDPGSAGIEAGAPAWGRSFPFADSEEILLPSGEVFVAGRRRSGGGGGAGISGPFHQAHNRCAPGCGYTSWGIWGDEAHQRRASCHNSGQAIDIHAITCGGRVHKSLSPRFDSYVRCMGGSLGVIYRSANHFNHAHFQLRGCNKCRGKGCGR